MAATTKAATKSTGTAATVPSPIKSQTGSIDRRGRDFDGVFQRQQIDYCAHENQRHKSRQERAQPQISNQNAVDQAHESRRLE